MIDALPLRLLGRAHHYKPDRMSPAHRASRCRQCGRKLLVGVRRGLAAAQLVEAMLAAALTLFL